MKEVQDRLGHGDIGTTMNIYAHITPKKKDKLAAEFGNYMRNKS